MSVLNHIGRVGLKYFDIGLVDSCLRVTKLFSRGFETNLYVDPKLFYMGPKYIYVGQSFPQMFSLFLKEHLSYFFNTTMCRHWLLTKYINYAKSWELIYKNFIYKNSCSISSLRNDNVSALTFDKVLRLC